MAVRCCGALILVHILVSMATWHLVDSQAHPSSISRQPSRIQECHIADDGTTVAYTGESVQYRCTEGYVLNGPSQMTCLSNGTFDNEKLRCVPSECKNIIPSEDETYVTTNGYELNFKCNKGVGSWVRYLLVRCWPEGFWSHGLPRCLNRTCPADTDTRQGHWDETPQGQTVTKQCQSGYQGQISRNCETSGEWLPPRYNCTSDRIMQIAESISADNVTHSLQQLAEATAVDKQSLQEGDLQTATSLLTRITEAANVTETETDSFVSVASNILDEVNAETWQAVSQAPQQGQSNGPEAASVLKAVESFASEVSQTVSTHNGTIVVEKKNIAIAFASTRATTMGIEFPDPSKVRETWVSEAASSVNLPVETVKDQGIRSYASAIYRNLSGVLSAWSKKGLRTIPLTLRACVRRCAQLSPCVYKPERLSPKKVTFHFKTLKDGYSNPTCSYWNFTSGGWSADGCELVSTNTTTTVCQCSHLTNFAILMSPWVQDKAASKVLDIVSIVGCSVSTLGLLITFIFHLGLWRYLKSDRVIILLNLCVALLASYAIFILGVDRTENKDVCTSIAALLQYIYLVVFFLLLVDGIELAVAILYVFSTKSRIQWLIPLAWVCPALIVGISLGVSRFEGYGTENFCWLSVDNGLVWAFVGPALAIIIILTILITLVIKVTLRSSTMARRSLVAKTKQGVRNLCVLLPMMGVTWVIGIFYVNSDSAWIQYVFAVCNGLQGFFIFLFHCILNKQMRNALQKKTSASTSRTSFSNPTVSHERLHKMSRKSTRSGD